jgi:phosphoglycerate dehydrogenase-like enzyme
MKLLLPDHLMDTLGDRVCQVAPECVVVPVSAEGEISEKIDDTEVLFLRWGLDRQVFQRLVAETSNLQWIHTISAGVEHVLFPDLVESEIVLTNASGVFDVPIAETVLGYMLAVAKRLPDFLAQQRDHRWEKQRLEELRGQCVGVVGMGSIGTEVARLCQAFGMTVLGLQRHPEPSEHADEVLPTERLPDLLARSDFVVIATPLTDETRGMIGAPELAAMKPDGWLINIARGAIVDQPALIEALEAEEIGGACLDVFVEEPLPEESPLWDLPNTILTPHNSWSSPHLEERAADLFLENLERYVAGEPLLNVVDKEAGY